MPLNVVVLAAGQGKRMFSALPKVLQPLAGKPLLRHVLDTARQLQPTRLIVVYGHGGEAVRQAFADASDVQWALQERQLGTGHALAQALPWLLADAPTLVLYGDVPLIQSTTLSDLLARQEGGLSLLTMHLDDPRGYGRIVRCEGDVAAIVEEKDATPEERAIDEVNTGIMAMPTRALPRWLSGLSARNAQGEYYLTDVVGMAAREGVSVRTAQPTENWEVEGVNDRQQLAHLERLWQGQLAAKLMRQGVCLADPARLDVRGALVCGRDVSIDVGVVFEGDVTLGDGVRVGPYCVIRDTTIEAGACIAAFSHLEGAQVGGDARVGPYARLRPGARLETGSHVGNFVEIKNSRLGPGSKANHLSYLGDADIGARVNIGAGTITCNYDGVHKFRTQIEDDVFIGSDTQLVAPVRVGKGATLGAGTTLTEDAPPDTLTLSRARQFSVPQWRRPQRPDEDKSR